MVVPAPGRTIYLAGQTGHGADDSIPEGLIEQFDAACANVLTALAGAGAGAEDLVSMQIFTTDLAGYLAESEEIGRAYRARFGRQKAQRTKAHHQGFHCLFSSTGPILKKSCVFVHMPG